MFRWHKTSPSQSLDWCKNSQKNLIFASHYAVAGAEAVFRILPVMACSRRRRRQTKLVETGSRRDKTVLSAV